MQKVYRGNLPYVFVSYAHMDEAEVMPAVSKLSDDGCRLWYDQGIQAGSEWPEYIATHLKKCALFIAFVSDNYTASNNCKREIIYAKNLNKPILIIYLKKLALPQNIANGLKAVCIKAPFSVKNKRTYNDTYRYIKSNRCIDPSAAKAKEIALSSKSNLSPEAKAYRARKNEMLYNFITSLLPIAYLIVSVLTMHLATKHYINGWLLALFTSLPLPIAFSLMSKLYKMNGKGLFEGNEQDEIPKLLGFVACFLISVIACMFFIHTTENVFFKILISIGLHPLSILVTALSSFIYYVFISDDNPIK